MKNIYTGATLLFVDRKKKQLEAVLKSYVLKSSTYDEIIEEARFVGEKQNNYNSQNKEYDFEYIGIEDIFQVVGPIEEGALLGRMTLWEQTLQDAKLLINKSEEYNFSEKQNEFFGKWYLATPVYYVEEEEIEDSRTISCHALIESRNSSLVIKKALAIAESIEFLNKIVSCDCEGLDHEDLKFLGFEDILAVHEDIQSGGEFLDMGKEYRKIEEIHELLLDNEEIINFFEYDD